MDRPGFTVETEDGKNFDANHLMICWNSEWSVAFICSGCLTTIPVRSIKEIRFSKEGTYYCNECDGTVPKRGL